MFENERYKIEQTIKGLLGQLENVDQYLEKKAEMIQEIEMLKQKIAEEKSERRREMADKDREKV